MMTGMGLDVPTAGEESGTAQSKLLFLDCLSLIERLHRRLLDVIKDRLERVGRSEINPVQALLLHNIGEAEMTAGELKSRGYYQGSNVSYNLKKLVEMGYIDHQRSEHDRRSVRVSLTEQGMQVRAIVDELYEEHLAEIVGDELIEADDLRQLRRNLRNLERFWSDQLRFAP